MNNRQIVTCFNKNENPPEKKGKNMSDNSVKERVILGSLHKNYMKFGTKKKCITMKEKKIVC